MGARANLRIKKFNLNEMRGRDNSLIFSQTDARKRLAYQIIPFSTSDHEFISYEKHMKHLWSLNGRSLKWVVFGINFSDLKVDDRAVWPFRPSSSSSNPSSTFIRRCSRGSSSEKNVKFRPFGPPSLFKRPSSFRLFGPYVVAEGPVFWTGCPKGPPTFTQGRFH